MKPRRDVDERGDVGGEDVFHEEERVPGTPKGQGPAGEEKPGGPEKKPEKPEAKPRR